MRTYDICADAYRQCVCVLSLLIVNVRCPEYTWSTCAILPVYLSDYTHLYNVGGCRLSVTCAGRVAPVHTCNIACLQAYTVTYDQKKHLGSPSGVCPLLRRLEGLGEHYMLPARSNAFWCILKATERSSLYLYAVALSSSNSVIMSRLGARPRFGDNFPSCLNVERRVRTPCTRKWLNVSSHITQASCSAMLAWADSLKLIGIIVYF